MPRYKIPWEERVRIIERYLSGEQSCIESIQAANNSSSSFRLWLSQYREGGAEALRPTEKNNTYSHEIKLAAVTEYLAGLGSLEEISRKYGLRSEKQLRNWIKVYNGGGDLGSVKHSGGGSYMKQGRDTTQSERIEIAKACLACGKNYGEVALKYQVSYQQARSWTKRYEELGDAGLEDRRGKRKKGQSPRTELENAQIEIAQLKHKLYLAELERDLLKKLEEIERRDAYRK